MKVYKHKSYSHVTVAEIDKRQVTRFDFALCKQPSETLKSFYNRQEEKPALLLNGGIFHLADGQTYYNYRDEGEDVSGWHWYTAGMGVVDGELKYGHIGSEKWRDFVSAYPPLIEAGKALPITYALDIEGKKRRSILAYNDKYIYCIAVEGSGMKFGEVQKMLLDMGVTYAINLDGGGSTKMLHKGKSVTSALYNRPVDNVVAVYLEDWYRVQTGAFKKEAYAYNMRDQIRAVPDTIQAGYAGAFIDELDGYYKVKIGLFRKQSGALLVVDDLKRFGIDAFVTKE